MYDYTIAGAGAAGLMIAYQMARDPFFHDKKILLLDQSKKIINDRTWCFWEEEGKGMWDSILFKKWEKIQVSGPNSKSNIGIDPFVYKMVRGLDFYELTVAAIQECSNIDVLYDTIESISETPNHCEINGTKHKYSSKHVFSSIFDVSPLKDQSTYPYLQQHFIGWFIETEDDIFDDQVATFMDFDIPQDSNTRFMYVLPFSKRKALIEYTLFSKHVLKDIEYEDAIKTYIDNLGIKSYKIYDKEKGNIPMSTYPFQQKNTERITYVGTAGGWSKACTGFTFQNTIQYSARLIENIKLGNPTISTADRFWYYDHIMLRVLERNNHIGAQMFINLFKKNRAEKILRFLDGKTTFTEDLSIMFSTEPTQLFVKEALLSLPLFCRKILNL